MSVWDSAVSRLIIIICLGKRWLEAKIKATVSSNIRLVAFDMVTLKVGTKPVTTQSGVVFKTTLVHQYGNKR